MATNEQDSKLAALAFLQQHPMAILSTISEDNRPWGAAIYYFADIDFNFYFLTKSETSKFKNLENTLYAALTVADPETQTTVQTVGQVSHVSVKQTIDHVFKNMAAQRPKGDYSWLPPIIKLHKGDWKVLRLTPSFLQFADYSAKKSDDGNLIKVLIPIKTVT